MISVKDSLQIREYQQSDISEIVELFHSTIHSICAKDYCKEQLLVWSDGNFNLQSWDDSLKKNNAYVAFYKDRIVGFGDIDESGYLDRLFVHKDFQGLGIGIAIVRTLERKVTASSITVHASLTAQEFFKKRGFEVITPQVVTRKGVDLVNVVMQKPLLR